MKKIIAAEIGIASLLALLLFELIIEIDIPTIEAMKSNGIIFNNHFLLISLKRSGLVLNRYMREF